MEITDGRWLNILGHYPNWAGASQACLDLARIWGITEIAPDRHGFPSKRDWRAAQFILLWGAAFLAAMPLAGAVLTSTRNFTFSSSRFKTGAVSFQARLS